MTTTFLDLQDGFYNALSQGLGFAPGSPFQLFQPSTPIAANNNTLLWNYLNNIPPYSLTQNYIASGGNQFFSDYSALIGALVAAPNNFARDVGPACNAGWNAFVGTLPYTTPVSQFPLIFRNWAIRNGYTSVAAIGAANLSAALLDPISNAGLALMMYTPNGSSPPNWSDTYAVLMEELLKGPKVSFGVATGQWNSNVSNSWTQSSNSGFFGLWGGSSSTSSQSATFAAAGVSLSASFANVITFAPTPGAWYSSAAMGLAFANQGGAPWNPSSPINWMNTFNPNTGNMARFATSLIVANQMTIQVESLATFSSSDQQTISQNSGAGMWPFYSSNSSGSTSTSVSFNASGNMTVNITSTPGVPIVLGCNVLPVAQYVGHAVEGAVLHAAALAKRSHM